jgi:hypothetical protein
VTGISGKEKKALLEREKRMLVRHDAGVAGLPAIV